jgi:hypothetical protein
MNTRRRFCYLSVGEKEAAGSLVEAAHEHRPEHGTCREQGKGNKNNLFERREPVFVLQARMTRALPTSTLSSSVQDQPRWLEKSSTGLRNSNNIELNNKQTNKQIQNTN